MKEDGASAALDARPLIVVGLNHNIIEVVGTLEVFVCGCIGQIHPAVIVSVANRLAPAPALSDR